MTGCRLFLAVFGALGAWSAAAVEADGSATTLQPVVVTAERDLPLTSGTAALGPAEIASRRARTSDTARLLLGIPGVSVYGAGGVSSLPVIHGLADDRLRTKVDGVSLVASCPNHMNAPLSYIDPTAVQSVEVFSGVTPVSVGGDSIGGSILVESAPAEFAASGEHLAQAEAGVFYRSNGDSWGGNLTATYATDTLSFRYAGSYAQADNYNAGGDFKDYSFTGREGHTLPLDEVGSTAFEAVNQYVKVGWQNDGNLVDIAYSYQHIPYENYPNQRMDMSDNLSDQFNLGYTGELAWGTLKARAYYEHTQHEMNFGDDKRFWYGGASGGTAAMNGAPCYPLSGGMNGCAAGMPMYTDGKNGGLTISGEIAMPNGDLVRVGGEYQNYRLDDWWTPSGANMWPYTFWNINDGQRDRYAVFGEWEIDRDRWTHILGMRLEAVDMDSGDVHGYNMDAYPTSGASSGDNQTRDAALFNTRDHGKTDFNLDLSWLARFVPEATQTYEIGLARKTRSPNLYERYTWSTWQMAAFMNNFVGDGNGYVGNIDLDPEVAGTISISGDWHDPDREQWGVKVTPYYSYVWNYIDAVQWDSATNAPRTVPVVDNFTVLKYFNQSAHLYGVDLSAHYLLARNTGYGEFDLSGLASYTRGENQDTGNNLYNIMPLNAKLTLTQQLGPWRNTIEGEFVAAKTDISEVRNEIRTAGYGLMHWRTRYEQKSWAMDIGIENVFDHAYDLPLGGAYLGQGTTMTIPPVPNEPQWGTAVPGPGRSIYAALSMKF